MLQDHPAIKKQKKRPRTIDFAVKPPVLRRFHGVEQTGVEPDYISTKILINTVFISFRDKFCDKFLC